VVFPAVNQLVGSVLTGLALVGRRPRRLLVVAVLGTFGYAVPCLLLALRAPESAVAAGALLARVGSGDRLAGNPDWRGAQAGIRGCLRDDQQRGGTGGSGDLVGPLAGPAAPAPPD
jgi:hypothetical protein